MAAPSEEEREALFGLRIRARTVVRAVGFLLVAIFSVDFLLDRTVSLSALYAIPVLVSLWKGSRRFTFIVTSVSVALSVAALSSGRGGEESGELMLILVNRAASIFTILTVASLGLMRMRAEHKLEDTREVATTTLRSIADAVITTDTRGRVTFVNPVAEALLGLQPGEADGRELDSVFHVTDEHPTPYPGLPGEPGRGEVLEGLLVTRAGKRIAIEVHRAQIRDGRGIVHGSVLVFRDVTARQEQEEVMRRLAFRDELTGLPNRTSLLDRMQLELAHARRNREPMALMYLDLDGFKAINDSIGHHAGDALLRELARRLRSILRAGDTVARLGGDEFTILLPGLAGPAEAQKLGAKILEALTLPVAIEEHDLRTGASIGVSFFPSDGDEPEMLLRRADKAMYRAKQLGGGRLEFYGAEASAGNSALTPAPGSQAAPALPAASPESLQARTAGRDAQSERGAVEP